MAYVRVKAIGPHCPPQEDVFQNISSSFELCHHDMILEELAVFGTAAVSQNPVAYLSDPEGLLQQELHARYQEMTFADESREVLYAEVHFDASDVQAVAEELRYEDSFFRFAEYVKRTNDRVFGSMVLNWLVDHDAYEIAGYLLAQFPHGDQSWYFIRHIDNPAQGARLLLAWEGFRPDVRNTVTENMNASFSEMTAESSFRRLALYAGEAENLTEISRNLKLAEQMLSALMFYEDSAHEYDDRRVLEQQLRSLPHVTVNTLTYAADQVENIEIEFLPPKAQMLTVAATEVQETPPESTASSETTPPIPSGGYQTGIDIATGLDDPARDDFSTGSFGTSVGWHPHHRFHTPP